MSDESDRPGFGGGFLFGFCAGALLLLLIMNVFDLAPRWAVTKTELIERDLGIYCPRTGIFAFNNECDKENDE